MSVLGLRVTIDPTSERGKTDGKIGFLGTVIKEKNENYLVRWNDEHHGNRIRKNSYDLRIYGSLPFDHLESRICSGCSKVIGAMRFKCLRCFDVDLCFNCYMNDIHELEHPFMRFETNDDKYFTVLPARAESVKSLIRGIHLDTKTVTGTEEAITMIDKNEGVQNKNCLEPVRKKAVVQDKRNKDRKCAVDVCETSSKDNVFCYITHLPILGKHTGLLCHANDFSVGEFVTVSVSEEVLRIYQKHHGGWNSIILDYKDAIGRIHRITKSGNIRVQYRNCVVITYNPLALARVEVTETIPPEYETLAMKIQDILLSVLDQTRKTSIKFTMEELKQVIEIMEKYFNCHESDIQTLLSGIMVDDDLMQLSDTLMDRPTLILNALFRHLIAKLDVGDQARFSDEKPFNLIAEQIILHIACYKGNLHLVQRMLSNTSLDLFVTQDGIKALHFAAHGGELRVFKFLVENGVNVNAAIIGITPLHIFVRRRFYDCIRYLFANGCDVNVQDSIGDTPLHDAIKIRDVTSVRIICGNKCADLSIVNYQGFNTLQLCSAYGTVEIMEVLIEHGRHLIDVKKSDGYSCLHIAALNGKHKIIETIMKKSDADKNVRTSRFQTPLHIAITKNRIPAIETLIINGADVTATDHKGNTAAHIACRKFPLDEHIDIQPQESPVIYNISQIISRMEFEIRHPIFLAVIAFLVNAGNSLFEANHAGITAASMIHTMIDKFGPIQKKDTTTESTAELPVIVINQIVEQIKMADIDHKVTMVECMVCSELSFANIIFQPCKHEIVCEDCSARMKKCLVCGVFISTRKTVDGRVIQRDKNRSSAERMRYLETKIATLAQSMVCTICLERKKDIMFQCGHSVCSHCSPELEFCPFCRDRIDKRINIF